MVNNKYSRFVTLKPFRKKLTVEDSRFEFVAEDKTYERVLVQNFGAYPVYVYLNGGAEAVLVADNLPLDVEIPIEKVRVELPLDRYQECEAEVQIVLFR